MHVHARHFRLIRFLSTTDALHHLVVLVGREDANEGHHALHESAPAWRQAVVLRLVHHLVNRHHWTFHIRVLRETRNRVGVWGDVCVSHIHALHILFRVLL